jgi:hypothetical protein
VAELAQREPAPFVAAQLPEDELHQPHVEVPRRRAQRGLRPGVPAPEHIQEERRIPIDVKCRNAACPELGAVATAVRLRNRSRGAAGREHNPGHRLKLLTVSDGAAVHVGTEIVQF